MLWLIIGASAVWFYYRTSYAYHRERFEKLQNLVRTRHTGKFRVFFISCGMVVRSNWLMLWQYCLSKLGPIQQYDHRPVLTYSHKGNLYKYVLPRAPVMNIVDIRGKKIGQLEEQNAMMEICPYLGPYQDWHGYSYRPNFWHYEYLTFSLHDGRELTFANTEPIILSP
jgi:hypothetical protein